MPGIDAHCKLSKGRTGKEFRKLHEWIDKFHKTMGLNHRVKRHAYNRKDEKLIKKFWGKKSKKMGDKAVVEWLFHIAVDNMETACKISHRCYKKSYDDVQLVFEKGKLKVCRFGKGE